jgi:hypothetical protein
MTAPVDCPASDLAEAAMGLISNAADWRLAGPPELLPECAEWVQAAQRWLATYQAWLGTETKRRGETPSPGVELARAKLAEARRTVEATLPTLRAQLAAESPAAASEGDNPGRTRTGDLRADLLPEAGSRFALVRHTDVTGISGTGVVAWGIVWPDGSVDIRWRGSRPSSVHWDNLDDPTTIHGHGGATEFVWIDDQPISSLPVDRLTAGTIAAELRVREANQ